MREQRRLSNRSVGQFNPQTWMEEGDGMLAVSQMMRANFKEQQRAFSAIAGMRGEERRSKFADAHNLLLGLPRSAMLLLGYSAEMFLKSGVVKAYQGCTEEMLDRDLKHCFGHQYIKAARVIDFPIEESDQENFEKLKNFVLFDARYPVKPDAEEEIFETVNRRNFTIWSDDVFNSLVCLVDRIRAHVNMIDRDIENPTIFQSFGIDRDGYTAFRIGGNLSPRVTYKVSSEMKSSGRYDLKDIRLILEREPECCAKILMYWDQCDIYEDGEKKTCLRKSARSAPNPHV